MSECIQTLNFFLNAVSKTAFISFVSLNLTQQQHQDIKFLYLHIKFHADQLKVCEKMKPTGFV